MGRPRDESSNKQNDVRDDDVWIDDSNTLVIDKTNRTILLGNDITDPITTQIVYNILSFAKQDSETPIKLIMNSGGGLISGMFAIYDTVRSVDVPIHTYGIGNIQSAAVCLLAMGDVGHRHIGKNTVISDHHTYKDSDVAGDVNRLKAELIEIEELQGRVERILMEETKLTKKQIDDMMSLNRDVLISPDEAVKFGIADSILAPGDLKL